MVAASALARRDSPSQPAECDRTSGGMAAVATAARASRPCTEPLQIVRSWPSVLGRSGRSLRLS